MKHSLLIKVAGGVLAGATVMAPAAAFADTTPPTTTPPSSTTTTTPTTGTTSPVPPTTQNFTQAQQRVEKALANRQTQLASLTTLVSGNTHLTSADQATLAGLLANETSGINALAAKVPTDTTMDQLRTDATSMVHDYRVYLVMTPQVNITVAADTLTGLETNAVNLEPQIQAAIQAAQQQGKDVSGAQKAFTDFQNQVTAAQGATNGVSAAVLAQTPQGYPGNATVFSTAVTSCKTAVSDMKAAQADLKTIQQDLGQKTSNAISGTLSTVSPTGSGSTATGATPDSDS